MFFRETFIYKKTNAISSHRCDEIVSFCSKLPELKPGTIICSAEQGVVDKQIKESFDITFRTDHDNFVSNSIRHVLNESFAEYSQRYKLEYLCGWGIDTRYNFQKYEIGGGYRALHCEQNDLSTRDRFLAWMIYLNDVPDGGTEFPVLNITTKAKKGTLLIWPGGFTHLHRSQISNTKEKYILTGWGGYQHVQ